MTFQHIHFFGIRKRKENYCLGSVNVILLMSSMLPHVNVVLPVYLHGRPTLPLETAVQPLKFLFANLLGIGKFDASATEINARTRKYRIGSQMFTFASSPK